MELFSGASAGCLHNVAPRPKAFTGFSRRASSFTIFSLLAGVCSLSRTASAAFFFWLRRDGRKSNGAQHSSYRISQGAAAVVAAFAGPGCIIASGSTIDPAREDVSCAARMIYPDHWRRESAGMSVFHDLQATGCSRASQGGAQGDNLDARLRRLARVSGTQQSVGWGRRLLRGRHATFVCED